MGRFSRGWVFIHVHKEPDCRLSALRAPRQRGKGSQLGTATSSLNREPRSAAASCVRDPPFPQRRAHGGPRTSTAQRPGEPHTARTPSCTFLAPQPHAHVERRAPPRPPAGRPRAAAGIRPAPPPGPAALPGPRDELGASRALSADPHGRARGPGATRRSSLRRSPAHPTRVRPSAPSSAPPSLSSPRVSSHPPPRPEVTPRKRADPRFLPSLAFFLLASVPPSLPRKESSFFLDGGDFGVGDLGEEGDFWGDDAMAARPALGDGGDGCEAPEPWEAAPGSERKRNYSRHLRQLRAALPLLPCLPPALRHAPQPAAAPLRPHLSRRGAAFPPRRTFPRVGSPRAPARGDPVGEKPRRAAARVRAEAQLRQGKGAGRQPERGRASGRCGVRGPRCPAGRRS
ncbi:hypothetical protein CIB84_009212 [Bambusicola thoracicus]|uniref:Uncharacterized protein n=1 Tax=Bambusicola thoracicus TaxID=9083 RepID=A0A2P4SSG2_BAMTH|nr:hypothetical protein CIB84_009212 [Bambusicola thoracicus]